MQSRDTEYWAEEAQFDHWRQMTPDQRAELFRSMCLATAEAHLSGLREMHPNDTPRELLLRSAALRYGRDLVFKLTGFDLDARPE
jgi:hypothetical protein